MSDTFMLMVLAAIIVLGSLVVGILTGMLLKARQPAAVRPRDLKVIPGDCLPDLPAIYPANVTDEEMLSITLSMALHHGHGLVTASRSDDGEWLVYKDYKEPE